MKKVAENLKKRGFDVEIFESGAQVKKRILEEIKKTETVGFGGSVTIRDLDVYEELEKRGNELFWHWKTVPEKRKEIIKKAMTADVYLSSSNALISDGRLLNIDGNGNRVNAMVYGPKKVIIVCSKNKIRDTYEEALSRIKTVACPQNARRLKRNTPCAHTDKCSDCKSKDRMCTITSLIEQKPPTMEYKIFLVEEDMGF